MVIQFDTGLQSFYVFILESRVGADVDHRKNLVAIALSATDASNRSDRRVALKNLSKCINSLNALCAKSLRGHKYQQDVSRESRDEEEMRERWN